MKKWKNYKKNLKLLKKNQKKLLNSVKNFKLDLLVGIRMIVKKLENIKNKLQ